MEPNTFVAAFEEMRGYASISDRRGSVVCPKPRRVGISCSSLLRSQFSYHSEFNNSREGVELLDLILKKRCPILASDFDVLEPFIWVKSRGLFLPTSISNCPSQTDGVFFLVENVEDFELEQQSPAVTALMTPFYSGSPPCRADNPLAQDARFRSEAVPPIAASPVFSPSGLPSPSSPALKGCVRMKFGPKPAAVRVEGFDCLSRDGQNSSVPAFA